MQCPVLTTFFEMMHFKISVATQIQQKALRNVVFTTSKFIRTIGWGQVLHLYSHLIWNHLRIL